MNEYMSLIVYICMRLRCRGFKKKNLPLGQQQKYLINLTLSLIKFPTFFDTIWF